MFQICFGVLGQDSISNQSNQRLLGYFLKKLSFKEKRAGSGNIVDGYIITGVGLSLGTALYAGLWGVAVMGYAGDRFMEVIPVGRTVDKLGSVDLRLEY